MSAGAGLWVYLSASPLLCTLLAGAGLRSSRIQGLVHATEMMQGTPDLEEFLTGDERGWLLPEYLLAVSRQTIDLPLTPEQARE